MNYHIGQEVVILVDYAPLNIKSGDTAVIKSMRLPSCKCTGIDVWLGHTQHYAGVCSCTLCGNKIASDGIKFWFHESEIAPLADISELEEILKQKEEA